MTQPENRAPLPGGEERPREPGGGRREPPDPLAYPDLYRGLAVKRMLAYFLDVLLIMLITAGAGIVFVLANVATFGLLPPILFGLLALIPFCYHTVLLGGPDHATIGMRAMGIEMRSLATGHPDYLQAGIQTALFYASLALFWPILLYIAFNARRRGLHDILAGTYFVNRRAALAVPA